MAGFAAYVALSVLDGYLKLGTIQFGVTRLVTVGALVVLWVPGGRCYPGSWRSKLSGRGAALWSSGTVESSRVSSDVSASLEEHRGVYDVCAADVIIILPHLINEIPSEIQFH